LAGQRLRHHHPSLASYFFLFCVSASITEIARHCPQALTQVDIAVEEVPDVSDHWVTRPPLAVARDATMDRLARIVIYRRPIEFRCRNRRQERELIFTTIVEQLSQVTGIAADQLAPGLAADDD
jgi:hypothetical protein